MNTQKKINYFFTKLFVPIVIIVAVMIENTVECKQQNPSTFIIQQRHQPYPHSRKQQHNPFLSLSSSNVHNFRHQHYFISLNAKRKDESDDDDNIKKPGMEEAFRQLDALKSLDDLNDATSAAQSSSSFSEKKKGILAPPLSTAAPNADVPQSIPLEKEIEAYKDMINELKSNEEAEAYSELMSELGGKSQSISDTYAEVMLDLGGTPQPKKPTSFEAPAEAVTTIITNVSADKEIPLIPTKADTDKLMNEALQEAVKEVTINNPSVSKSILDDKEIMKEIEAIFEQGNEKLIESLNEIRKEQEELAKLSAERNAQKVVDDITTDTQRMMNAEVTMQNMLQRVDTETKQVEQAMKELKQANAELDQDFIYKLKKGGLPKQAALIGFLLFSGRSIIDTLTAFQSDDQSYLLTALIQGAVAIVCAAIFFFL